MLSITARPTLILATWLALAGVGLSTLWSYGSAPGDPGTPPASWPLSSRGGSVELRSERFTLVMFAHPHCPCTRASLEELDRLMVHAGARVAATVLFFDSPAFDEAWNESDLYERARAIPGVACRRDPLGAEARRFGAATSGHVVLYRPDGSLAFAGGITPGRGHAGDNVGRTAILALLDGDADEARSAVYGCRLLDDCGAEASEEDR